MGVGSDLGPEANQMENSVEENRKAWLAKLRDPETKQGFGFLIQEDGSMCAMGAACQVWGKPRYVYWDVKKMIEFFGITTEEVTEIVSLNDRDRKTLPEIADWLESRWSR